MCLVFSAPPGLSGGPLDLTSFLCDLTALNVFRFITVTSAPVSILSLTRVCPTFICSVQCSTLP